MAQFLYNLVDSQHIVSVQEESAFYPRIEDRRDARDLAARTAVCHDIFHN